ncbi:MAG: hypothetical protein HON90_18045, partial [Halobacteriovoraceae bacterium]|nr:hypothetical protein [Halobacteriovoraceae bacterium]
ATMSTLDSTINALSSCLYNDIFHHRETSAKKIKLFYFRDTLAITLILMSIAFWASTSDGLLIFGLKITSWTAGSLLALFFGVSVFKLTKLTTFNVIGVYIVGVLGVSINTYLLQWNWNLNIYFGFSLGLLFLYTKTKIYQRAFP